MEASQDPRLPRPSGPSATMDAEVAHIMERDEAEKREPNGAHQVTT